jgi:hypothetical protein
MAQLTLHEAMAVVLRDQDWMDRDDLARELAERDLYRRPKDGQPPPSYQLGMRVRRYPHWFEARGPSSAQIRLVPGGPGTSITAPRAGRR